VSRMKHKVIISGTGRSGTTMLVQLLTKLGLDTGFNSVQDSVYENCNAGMEYWLEDPNAPYIVKNPWLCDYLEGLLETGEFTIDHAFVPVRNLTSAAQSRISVNKKSGRSVGDYLLQRHKPVPGGLWHTSKPSQQEGVLAKQLYKLMYVITLYDIPHTFMHFPRIASDSDYLFTKLAPVLSGVSKSFFDDCFNEIVKPELVNSFEE